MSEIRYNFGEIEAIMGDLSASKHAVDSLLDELKSFVRSFADAHWNGAAQQAYLATQAKWDGASAELNTVLQSVITCAQRGAAQMQSVEMSNAASWG